MAPFSALEVSQTQFSYEYPFTPIRLTSYIRKVNQVLVSMFYFDIKKSILSLMTSLQKSKSVEDNASSKNVGSMLNLV